MSRQDRTAPEPVQAAAAAWVVRLQATEAGEADWLAFEAWLNDAPGARDAYDAAMALWLAADGLATRDFAPPRRAGAKARVRSHGHAALGLGGVAALAVLLLVVVQARGPQVAPATLASSAPTPSAYATAIGAGRTIALADGSVLTMSGGSQVRVSLTPQSRRVAMISGEVAFKVAHNPRRPFLVDFGDRQVRDVGTEFDVRRINGVAKVTVREGEVEVVAAHAAEAASPVVLQAGRQFVHDEATGASSVRSVVADDVFAWEQGRLIYRDQPLKVVVNDLNRYFPHAVRIDGERVAALRFTGVITVDGEAATIRRLTELLPITATEVNGATVLRARDSR